MYERSYVSSTQYSIKPHKHHHGRKLLLVFIVVVALTVVGFHIWPHQVTVQAVDKRPPPGLGTELQALFQNYPDVDVGVALINLNNDTTSTYGQTTPFTGASTTKILTAADFLHYVEQGKYSLGMPLGAYTANWQLQEMVNQSDDDSWSLFLNLLGNSQLTAYARQLGLQSFNADNNTIAPLDEAKLLQQLYQGKLLNKSDTSLVLSYMQNTNDETLIPAALPAGAIVYHKYGELVDTDDDGSGNFVHDAAIISYHGQTFVLTIYTNETMELDITNRQMLIHQITTDVVQAEA